LGEEKPTADGIVWVKVRIGKLEGWVSQAYLK
jgi:hypothetical protein